MIWMKVLLRRILLVTVISGSVIPLTMTSVLAEGFVTTPINISLFTPLELIPVKPRRVVGVSLNVLYGHEEQLYGLQAGLVNHVDSGLGIQVGLAQWSDGDFSGLQVGLVNFTHEFFGIQVGGGNITHTAGGVQASLGSNYSEKFSGIQIGAWNSNRQDFSGIQIGLVNENQVVTTGGGSMRVGNQKFTKLNRSYSASGSSKGLQIAFALNEAVTAEGVQISLFNFSASMHGVQIGAINYAENLKGIQIGLLNFNESGLFMSPGLNIGW